MDKREMLKMAENLRLVETYQDLCRQGKMGHESHKGFTVCPFAADELYKVIRRLEA